MQSVSPSLRPKVEGEARRMLWVACGAHVLHDGFTDTLYVLLPLWQAEFALGYAAVGALRALYTAAMAGLQVPSDSIFCNADCAPRCPTASSFAHAQSRPERP
jgi:hypothetical protein